MLLWNERLVLGTNWQFYYCTLLCDSRYVGRNLPAGKLAYSLDLLNVQLRNYLYSQIAVNLPLSRLT